MQRIIIHWTAGGTTASASDLAHYHRLIDQRCQVIAGTEEIADNIVTTDGDYAAHTLRLNTGSIGVGLCGMRGAREVPFHPGPSPINEQQLRAAAIEVASLCKSYGIRVTPRTVLTHAEVEPTLGVRQRGKWDISRLPWRDDIRGAVPVGDYIRNLVVDALAIIPGGERLFPTVARGDRGAAVRILQAHLGLRQTARFDDELYMSVVRFQQRHRLGVDGIVGPNTWAAIDRADKMGAAQCCTEFTL